MIFERLLFASRRVTAKQVSLSKICDLELASAWVVNKTSCGINKCFGFDKIFEAIAANMKTLLKIVEKYDGTEDISMWLDQLKMLMKVQNVTEELHEIIPLFLKGNAYEVYSQFDDDILKSSALLEKSLRQNFGVDSFEAFAELRKLKWRYGESVPVYLAKIKRTAATCKIESESFILHQFMTGLPDEAARQLRTQVKINALTMGELVERATVILKSSSTEGLVSMPMAVNKTDKSECANCGRFGHMLQSCRQRTRGSKLATDGRGEITCYTCREKGHISTYCPSKNTPKTCFRCGTVGHIAVQCKTVLPVENDEGKLPAPATSRQG
jgi:hypothetical protein